MTSLYLLLIFGSTTIFAGETDKLISVVVLFRHGDRAPTDRVSNISWMSYFPNGLGELTDRGIENSFRLGKYLRDRYVSSGFLRVPLLPSQVYFRSRGNNRCLMSASLIASAMFGSIDRPTEAAVPVYSQEGKDLLLGGTSDCVAEVKRMKAVCGKTPKSHYENFTEFHGVVYECLQLHKKSKIFPNGKSFEIADSLINEHKNGLPMPDWFHEHKEEFYRSLYKVENFMLGSGEYHNPDILRIKSGLLLHTVLNMFKSNWEKFLTHGSLEKKKFVAFSTQDWLIHSFMDALGIRAAALGETGYPPYNTLVILELRKINDVPVIKAYYRDPLTETLNDVTSSIRGCGSYSACPLKDVLNCCGQYITSDKEEECHPKKSTQR
ncbi:hypothetical protein RB195_020639 [Necator americanus]|uniref:Histidine acid phosphatase n=1 Tax=Necator americanus TaxID=51031 RepID=A0ABR1CMJ2_NECAM